MKNLTELALWFALPGLCALAPAAGAQMAAEKPATEVAFTYSALRTNAPVGGCGCFWNNGGSIEVAVPLWGRLSTVTEFSGEHAGSIPGNPGTSLSLMSALAGLRIHRPIGRRFEPFAQGLIGAVHAFDSYFPSSIGPSTNATSFALAAGGGVDVAVTRRWRVRPIQLDYQFMHLPNNAGNEQHDLRISAGIVLRFHR